MIQLLIGLHLILLTISIVQQDVITVRWHSHASQRLVLEDYSLPLHLALFRVLVIANVGGVLAAIDD